MVVREMIEGQSLIDLPRWRWMVWRILDGRKSTREQVGGSNYYKCLSFVDALFPAVWISALLIRNGEFFFSVS